MTSSSQEAVQLYQITYLGTGPQPDVRTVEAGEVAAVIKHAGEHGVQVLVRPCTDLLQEPDTGKEDAS
ncbi:hypothetical protein [Streptomyces erythrochromogenes]|uniref:hypothetical protein n=1 Tax=Streptomyces erythrochromogenes TaxID=285574 RepID=UPI0002E2D515